MLPSSQHGPATWWIQALLHCHLVTDIEARWWQVLTHPETWFHLVLGTHHCLQILHKRNNAFSTKASYQTDLYCNQVLHSQENSTLIKCRSSQHLDHVNFQSVVVPLERHINWFHPNKSYHLTRTPHVGSIKLFTWRLQSPRSMCWTNLSALAKHSIHISAAGTTATARNSMKYTQKHLWNCMSKHTTCTVQIIIINIQHQKCQSQ